MTPQRSWASKSKATTALGCLPSWNSPPMLWPSHLLGQCVTRHSWCKLLDDISPVLQQNLANLGDQKTFHWVLFTHRKKTQIVQSMDPLAESKSTVCYDPFWGVNKNFPSLNVPTEWIKEDVFVEGSGNWNRVNFIQKTAPVVDLIVYPCLPK